MIYDELRPKFWENYPLDALTDAEWEALCDGCGACCLVKFLDDDNVKLTEYTDVACQLLDCSTGFCQNYAKRQTIVPDCIRLTPDMLPDMLWFHAIVLISGCIFGKICQHGTGSLNIAKTMVQDLRKFQLLGDV